MKTGWLAFGTVVVLAALVMLLASARSNGLPTVPVQPVSAGQPEQGRQLLASFGCGSCHTIPGVGGADGRVGPPLVGLQNRAYIAGRLPNSQDNLAQWIMHPQEVDPGNAMPDLGVPQEAAQNMAAYLYTLR